MTSTSSAASGDPGRRAGGGPRRPVRLLAVGHAEEGWSFSRVLDGILGHLGHGYEIHRLALGSWGWRAGPPPRWHPCLRGDPYGIATLPALLDAVRPDVVLVLHDLWVLPEYLGVLEGRRPRPRLVAHAPLDGTIEDPRLVASVPDLDALVLPSEFGRREVLRALAELGAAAPALEVIPHGVNRRRFRPLADRGVARRRALGPAVGADEFVVLNGNRNFTRKRLDLTLGGFALFAAGKSDVRLVLHCAPVGAGVDAPAMVRALGLGDRLILTGTDDAHPVLSDGALNRLYNACDVGLNTSMGEGFGLVSLEHAATGAAQVVPRHSACAELWADAAEWLEPVEEESLRGLVRLAAVSAEGVAAALERLYRDPEGRRRLGAAALAVAGRPEHDWGVVGRRFDAVVRGTLHMKRLEGCIRFS